VTAGGFSFLRSEGEVAISLAIPFKEELHPRFPVGDPRGGQFKPKGATSFGVGVTGSSTVDVLINPTEGELTKFARQTQFAQVRVIRDQHGNIYAWDADQAVHETAIRKLGFDEDDIGINDTDVWDLEGKFLFSPHGANVSKYGDFSETTIPSTLRYHSVGCTHAAPPLPACRGRRRDR
jgi:hypothetical protein